MQWKKSERMLTIKVITIIKKTILNNHYMPGDTVLYIFINYLGFLVSYQPCNCVVPLFHKYET